MRVGDKVKAFVRIDPRLSAWIAALLQLTALVGALVTLLVLSRSPQVEVVNFEPVACVDQLELIKQYKQVEHIIGPAPVAIVDRCMPVKLADGPKELIVQQMTAKKWTTVTIPGRQIECWFEPSRSAKRDHDTLIEYDAARKKLIEVVDGPPGIAAREAWHQPDETLPPEYRDVNALTAVEHAAHLATPAGSTIAVALSALLGPFEGSYQVNALVSDPFPDFVATSSLTGHAERWAWDNLQNARWNINRLRIKNTSDEFAEFGMVIEGRGPTTFMGGDIKPDVRGTRFVINTVKLFPGEERWMVFRTRQVFIDVKKDVVQLKDPTLRPSRDQVRAAGFTVLIVFLALIGINVWLAREARRNVVSPSTSSSAATDAPTTEPPSNDADVTVVLANTRSSRSEGDR